MTRKKFVKYLMSKGLPRNKASLFAEWLRYKKVPYNCFGCLLVCRQQDRRHHVTAALPMGYSSVLREEVGCISCVRIKMPEWRTSDVRAWLLNYENRCAIPLLAGTLADSTISYQSGGLVCGTWYPNFHSYYKTYIQKKTEYEKRKARNDIKKAIKYGIVSQRSNAVNRAMRRNIKLIPRRHKK